MPSGPESFDEQRGEFLRALSKAKAIQTMSRDELIANTDSPEPPLNSPRSPWDSAQSAADFVENVDPEVEWLEYPLLAPGYITEVFSPRGIGKTLVAHRLAVKLALSGHRVLLLDRDNPRSLVKRRLRAWGAAQAPLLRVMGRDQVPPLTDRESWAEFPVKDYDLVIIDSLDATAEGMGEKDSAKPSRAIAPLLDIAHAEHGPAMLVLGNTIKSAAHSRGSGVIEDRADICFEVRDATGFQPSGKKDWWLELPQSGADAWGDRATRRKGQTIFRLAFVPSKFRAAVEPDPFILELDLSGECWMLREVTEHVVHAGEQARAEATQQRQDRLEQAAQALSREVHARMLSGHPMRKESDAVPFLCCQDLKRQEARQLLQARKGHLWRLEAKDDERGKPIILLPVSAPSGQTNTAAAEIPQSETPRMTIGSNTPISADRMDTGRRKSGLSAAAPDAEFRDPLLFPPTDFEQHATSPSLTANREEFEI